MVGSVILATPEATELSDDYKSAVVDCGYGETIHTKVFDIANEATIDDVPWPDHIGMRVRENDFTRKWHGSENTLVGQLDDIGPDYTDSIKNGDLRTSPVLVGEGAGSIRSVQPVAAVIENICDKAQDLLAQRYRSLSG